MRPEPFALERYFARYEFSVRHLLSSSDCDGLALAEVLSYADPQARSLWDGLTLGYTESLGLPLLRDEITGLYEGIGHDDVLVAVPEEGILLAMQAVLEKGDHVIATFPGYQSLYAIAQSLGCEVEYWKPDEGAGWKFEVAALESMIRPTTKLLVVNFPHNPTGSLPSREEYGQIVEIARRHDLYLFSDEMYRFLELPAADRLPAACEAYENAVSLFGMSKTFGLAGLRLGWVITRNRWWYQRMAELKDYTTICSSAPSEILALIAIRARERIIARHIERISRNLSILDDFFTRNSRYFLWVRPRAGTIAFPRMLFAEDALSFCERTAQEAGIMVLPSTVYGYDAHHFRIGFGRERMPEALTAFEEYFTKHPPKT